MTEIVVRDGARASWTLADLMAGGGRMVTGTYDPLRDRIVLWHGGLSPDEANASLNHELQHANDRTLLLVFRGFCLLTVMIMSAAIVGAAIGSPFPPLYCAAYSALSFVAMKTVHWLIEARAKKAEADTCPTVGGAEA